MASSDLTAAAQSLIGSDEAVLAAGIFTIPDSAASLTKGSLAAAIAIPGDANPILSGAGSVAAVELARHEEAKSKGLTERMVVAVTERSIHLLSLPKVGKAPERHLARLDRDGFEVKISKLGLSRKLQLTHRESGEKLKLMGYTVGPTDVAKGDKAVLEGAQRLTVQIGPVRASSFQKQEKTTERTTTMANEKKIAVVGATGRLGHHVVEVLRERGHEVVPASRASGVDVISGEGLAEALDGVEVIVDAATGPSPDEQEATEFFTTAAANLQRAGAEHGVAEIIAVSIIGVEHFHTGYYAGKVAQERVHRDGPVPTRFLRASQFHEFVAELVKWGTQGETAYIAEMRTQLIAARSVAEALADLVDGADGAPLGNPVSEVAGPREESLVEAAKLLVARRGERLEIEAVEAPDDPEGLWAAGALLPGPIARLAGPTYEQWLELQTASA